MTGHRIDAMTDPAPLRVVSTSDEVAEAGVPAPASAPSGRQPVTIPLSVPIEAHGEQRTTLTLRPLKVDDIEACDLCANVTTRKLSDCLVRLAGIPRSSMLQLAPADYMRCLREVTNFLGEQVPTS